MGSVTNAAQVDLASALEKRNEKHGVEHGRKAEARKHIEPPGIHRSMYLPCAKIPPVIAPCTQADLLIDADFWWKEAGMH